MKSKKIRPKKRTDVERPYCNGEWTKARFVSFVKSALRGARWGPKYVCIKNAFVENGINPKTGRQCKLHKCPQCDQLLPQGEMVADHITAVIGPEGFTNWDNYIQRLFCEAEGFQALCRACHNRITKHETQVRTQLKSKQLPLL